MGPMGPILINLQWNNYLETFIFVSDHFGLSLLHLPFCLSACTVPPTIGRLTLLCDNVVRISKILGSDLI